MRLGFDIYNVEIGDIILFLQYCKKEKIHIYRIRKKSALEYMFYSPIYQRYKLKKLQFIPFKSIGILHYLLLLTKSKANILACVAFLCTIYIAHGYIFEIDIDGNNPTVDDKVRTILEDKQINLGSNLLSYSELNNIYVDIKEECSDEIDFLNVYQQGSMLKVEYTSSVKEQEQALEFTNLVASQDAVIYKIDVQSGNVLVKANQYVKAGEILVSNQILSTNEEVKTIPVSGEIKAYTYKQYVATISINQMSKDEAFEVLLHQIRGNIHQVSKIDSETVQSYDIIGDEIVLTMQYIFIENIAVKEK